LIILCVVLEIPTRPISNRDRHDNFLQWQCEYYELNYDILKSVRKAESEDRPHTYERKNGKIISRGYFRICLATAFDFYDKNGLPQPDNLIDVCYDPYVNQEIACWQIRKYLDIFRGDYKAALSAHNMGLTGFLDYRRETGNVYRWVYIDLVRRNGAKCL
jgi:hypothetical protein